MKMTLTVTDRGTVTLPAKLRRELGIRGNDLLIAETTGDGVLLRPAVTLPVEIYDAERVAEFAAAEGELAEWYNREKATGEISDPGIDAGSDQ
ncbi:MAG: AbrB/MazE/SpoVT family DNA-binding domain-containing protein [Spirochaetaceae bacterium]|nr:MAG: AbrB/MazE/SpoVT family DNA-binding domain-containing protein [Spirochaetaceae bacterium]